MSSLDINQRPGVLTGEEALEFVKKQYIGSPEIVGNLALLEVISKQDKIPDVSVAIYDIYREDV